MRTMQGEIVKARLVLDLEFPDGSKQTREIHHLEFGSGIYFYDYYRDEVRETGMTIAELNEVRANDHDLIRHIESTGDDFLELILLAKMLPAEHDDARGVPAEKMRIVDHFRVPEGTDPYSYMLGPKKEEE